MICRSKCLNGIKLNGKWVHKNLIFADRGEGGVQNGQKNADVINERPLMVMVEYACIYFICWF